jgi:hypothetical protein
MKNLKYIGQKILDIGEDIDTCARLRRSSGMMNEPSYPLAIAAYHGHEQMVLLPLEAGVSQALHETRVPLAVATRK